MVCKECKYFSFDEDECCENESNKCSLIDWHYFKPFDEEKACIFVNDDYSINESMIEHFAK